MNIPAATYSGDNGLFQSTLSIEAKLDQARVRLLDLSARNRLLNVPRSKTRSGSLIDVVDEKSAEVYRLLVKDSKPLTFMPGRLAADGSDSATPDDADEIADLAQPEDESVDSRGVANRHADTRLQTRLTSKGLQKRLLTLYFDARTLEEEQGVNVLYLGLGTLKWIDPNNATNVRYAPLVLVPVALERATAGDRFKLRWRQEDPSSNLSLEAMVDRVHLLKLPAFEATDDFDISAYCAGVAAAVSSKSGWEVAQDDIVLGFFSFSKFLMYRDLSPETWPVASPLAAQPLIRSLLRDGFPSPSPGLSDDASIDPLLPPDAMLHIVDSDSSQTLAVHDARQGRHLVIQGPPGTGKSQTIANIIAGAVADGKTVLFVAEKMAALDVVKRRLDATGVGDACLELHSNKANKRLLLDELKRTWALGSPRGTSASSLTHRLTTARDVLNAHVERLHRLHPTAEVSAYTALGQITRLRDEGQPPNDVTLSDAVSWSGDGFRERLALVHELAERIGLIGQPSLHPWRGVGLTAVMPNELTRLLERIGASSATLSVVSDAMAAVASQLQQDAPTTTHAFEPIHLLAQRLASAPDLEAAALAHDAWDTERGAIAAMLATGQEWCQASKALQPLLRPDALTVAVGDALGTMATLPDTFGPEAFARCHTLVEMLLAFVIEVGRLKTQLGLDGAVDTLAAVSKAATTGQRVAAAPDASPEVFAAAIWDTGVEQAAELSEAVAKVEDARAAVGDSVLPAAWITDTERERQVIRLKSGSLLRWLSGDWRRANALLRSLVRDPKQPPAPLLALLDAVAEGRTALSQVKAGDALGQAAFGTDWQGERSQSAPLRALVAWMRSLRGLGAAPRLIAGRLPDRSDIGARSARVQQQLHQVRQLLEGFWTDLGPASAQGFDDVASVTAARLSQLLSRISAAAKADAVATQVLASPDVPVVERRVMFTQIQAVQMLAEEIRQRETLGAAVLGGSWRGTDTDWTACAVAAEWVAAHSDVRVLASQLPDRQAPMRAAVAASALAAAWHLDFATLLADLRSDAAALFGTASANATPSVDLSARLELWARNGEQLSKWTAYRDRADRASTLGVGDVVARLDDGRLTPRAAAPAFEMAYFEAVLSDMVRTDAELARFDGELHARTVREFAQLDRERLIASRVEVVQAHHRRLPPPHGGVGPLGILRAEMARQRGLMPIRQLMQRAAPAVQALKPVLMMSPLSIAQFLPAGQITFDLLVMDEASQIQPVDALGAIARCRQVIVVGDERQLPPTRFFSKVTDGDDADDDDGAQVGDIESILGLFSARGLQQRMLRWHYRSRHQSLIAVSNSQFYENKLIIVPSPYTAEAGMGLSFHYLPDGVFDTGGTGTNAVEAAAVASAIIEHARANPEQSLGVATFSVRQRRAILDQVEILRRDCPDTEAFFHAHPSEPFFVKNLENVQGDERDVIFISVGYGRSAQGVMSMRFGPLGNDGGERRLNVLISRAKLRCVVYSSITDDDINLERARGKGVVAFKLFLRFARTGRLDLPGAEAAGVADVFESQVAAALQAKGYQVHPRVGIAGLFIDLAVADPETPGRYVLGIECDGQSYHAARSARDRDRLRRAVLEDHGWAMHRIWSFDWFQRPQEELARLVAAIETAKHDLAGGSVTTSRRRRAVQVEVLAIDRDDVTEIGLEPVSERSGAEVYEETALRALPGYADIPSVPLQLLAALVETVVEIEGPVHLDVVVVRVRDAWGAGRAGSRIQAAVESAVDVSLRAKRIHRIGDFLSRVNEVPVPRDRASASSVVRKPDMVAPEEIREAVVHVVQRNLGAKHAELPTAVAKLLGFSSTTGAWRDITKAQVAEAQRRGRVVFDGDMVLSPSGKP